MKKHCLALTALLLLSLSSCGSSQGASSISNGQEPLSSTEVLQPMKFTPEVGEIRKWFDHGKIGEDRYYNYCPSVFVEDNIKHIYYCSNKMFGNVTDYVAYREGKLQNEQMTYTDTKDIVWALSPTPDTWDARHVCDPSVIKGEFSYGGQQYSYLMAYLGCLTSDNSRNETGLAVAQSPEGPWVKCDSINPIVPYTRGKATWGTGQPALVSVDHKGRVLLLNSYTNSDERGEQAWEFDFSNLEKPRLIRSKHLMNLNGLPRYGRGLNNCDVAYDEVHKKIILARGTKFGDDRSPNYIASQVDVYYLDDSGNENRFDEIFKESNNARDWVLMGSIGEEQTGFPRNHNTGLVTDPYGELVESDRIEVAFTRSDLSPADWGYWSTYRIYSTAVPLTYLN